MYYLESVSARCAQEAGWDGRAVDENREPDDMLTGIGGERQPALRPLYHRRRPRSTAPRSHRLSP